MIAHALGGVRRCERDTTRTTEAEQVAVDRIDVEATRLGMTIAERRTLREAERDERLSADARTRTRISFDPGVGTGRS